MMSPSPSAPLPALCVADFGPGLDHVAESSLQDKAFAILHKDDPARAIIPRLVFAPDDPYVYVFIHGGENVTRFQNLSVNADHEIPAQVVAQLLQAHYGDQLDGMKVRVCACYGNLLRPGDLATAVELLARELPRTEFEGYHGLVRLRTQPAVILLGASIQWDPLVGPMIVGPPGDWERVVP
jgi:hypothetical protein